MARAAGRARDRKSGVRARRERGGERTLWIGSAMAVEKRENDETRAFKWVKLYEKRAQTWLRKAGAARLPGNPALSAVGENTRPPSPTQLVHYFFYTL